MEQDCVTELDQLRNKVILWLLISWGLWWGSVIISRYVQGYIGGIVAIGGLVAFGVVFFNGCKMYKLTGLMKKDRNLADSLNDELWRENVYRSFRKGFMINLGVLPILYCISLFTRISGGLVCEILIFTSVVACLTSFLIYNRTDDGDLDA